MTVSSEHQSVPRVFSVTETSPARLQQVRREDLSRLPAREHPPVVRSYLGRTLLPTYRVPLNKNPLVFEPFFLTESFEIKVSGLN